MAKQKPKHSPGDPEKKKKNKKHVEVDPLDESNWIVVNKQRVIILIPPLPGKVECTMPNVEESQIQQKDSLCQSPTKFNSGTHASLAISALKELVNEKDKSISLPLEQAIPTSVPNILPLKPLSSLDGKDVGIYHTPKLTKGMGVCVCSNSLPDRRMRAINLDKKIKKAGGLENWLFSVGLNCFVNIFQKNKVNKFQLSNLTMNKLQDMGAYAVGPRRKLMHAIGCLCEPHCFQSQTFDGIVV